VWSVSCPTQLTNSCTLVDEPSPGLLSPDPGSCRPGAGPACQPEQFENVCACVPQSLGDKAKDAYKDAKDAVQVSCRQIGQRLGCIIALVVCSYLACLLPTPSARSVHPGVWLCLYMHWWLPEALWALYRANALAC